MEKAKRKTAAQKLKYFGFLVVAFSFSLFAFSFAFAYHGEEVVPEQPASYLFHLYYDNGQLFADRDFEFKYDVIPGEYLPSSLNTDFPYRGEVINLLNQVAVTFEFDPRLGDPSFRKGKISVKAPYVPDGQKATFYDSQGKQLLIIFVSDSSFCNDDGFCDFNKGEDEKTCSNDCKFPVVTSGQQPTKGGEKEGEEGFNPLILWPMVGVLAVVGGWYSWQKWKKRQNVQETGLPTNPGGL